MLWNLEGPTDFCYVTWRDLEKYDIISDDS